MQRYLNLNLRRAFLLLGFLVLFGGAVWLWLRPIRWRRLNSPFARLARPFEVWEQWRQRWWFSLRPRSLGESSS